MEASACGLWRQFHFFEAYVHATLRKQSMFNTCAASSTNKANAKGLLY